MKTSSIRLSSRCLLAAAVLAAAAISDSAQAAALTWDSANATVGTWDVAPGNLVWGNGTTNVPWTQTNATSATNSAIFGYADGNYTITVGTGVATSSMSFLNSGYAFNAASPQQIFLTPSPGSVANSISIAANKTATIGANVTIAQQNALVGGGGTLNISGAGAKLDSNGGTNLNILGGTTVNVMTGGTFNAGVAMVVGRLEGDGTLLVNGGTVTVGTAVLVLGNTATASTSTNGTLTLSSGTVTVSSVSGSAGLRFGSNTAGTFSNSGTVNLDGGTLTVSKVFEGTGGTTTSAFNFNGGTLKVVTGSTFGSTFMTGLDSANVKEGGAVVDTNGIATTIGQALVHGGIAPTDGGLSKLGNGTLTLTGNNTYTGATSVTTGTLILSGSGSISASANITVSTGATFTNNATVLSNALVLGEGSNLAGSSSFTPASLTLTADLTGGTFTQISLGSALAKSGALGFTLSNVIDGSYPLFTGTAPTGSFASVAVGGNALADQGGGVFSAEIAGFNYTFTDSSNILDVAAIPEPGTWVLVALGLTFLLYPKTRRRSDS